MSKKANFTEPFKVVMTLPVDGLMNLPPEATPEKLFMDVCIRAIVLYSKAKNGLAMPEHRRLQSLRTTMDTAIKNNFKECELEIEDYKFLMKCWGEQRPQAEVNELVMRVEKLLRDSQSDWDKRREASGQDSGAEIEPAETQE